MSAVMPSPWPAGHFDEDDFSHYDAPFGLTPSHAHTSHPSLPPTLSAHLSLSLRYDGLPFSSSLNGPGTPTASGQASLSGGADRPTTPEYLSTTPSVTDHLSAAPSLSFLAGTGGFPAIHAPLHATPSGWPTTSHTSMPATERGGGGSGYTGCSSDGAEGAHGATKPSPLTAAYGEGLAALLGHLSASRQPQVQAWLQLKEDLQAADEEAMLNQGWDDLNDLEEEYIQLNHQHLASKSWLTIG